MGTLYYKERSQKQASADYTGFSPYAAVLADKMSRRSENAEELAWGFKPLSLRETSRMPDWKRLFSQVPLLFSFLRVCVILTFVIRIPNKGRKLRKETEKKPDIPSGFRVVGVVFLCKHEREAWNIQRSHDSSRHFT